MNKSQLFSLIICISIAVPLAGRAAEAKAGYSGDPAKCAFKIQENSGFKRYLSELQAENRTGAIMTRTKRLERLSAMHRARMEAHPQNRRERSRR